jgi:serine/threonine protein kinase
MEDRQRSAGAVEPQYIADRYRVEKGLGHGGMAVVYRVMDTSANREVALKLLSQDAVQNPHLVMQFEREFYTLAQLAHPRIIEVYDFGVDKRGAYYTMELLDGADLRTLAPIHWKEACALLRDVASSLALIHSRRLLHRDISARNVRCTRDSRAKVIDFGAMAPFGAQAKVIGTPAFIAPEALNHQPLDQRADLYSLGVLAYWLITHRYAYQARHLGSLPDAWRTPPLPLSVLNPEVPEALNSLIMSLINLDRMARPFYASDVGNILGACAGLPPDDTVEVRQSYLTTPQLVGRAALVTKTRELLLTIAQRQTGDTLLLEGPGGIGRSRLLAEIALEGKIIGATVLATGADAAGRDDYGVAWELIKQLFENAYDLALEAVKPHIEVLSGIFPGLLQLVAERTPPISDDPDGLDPVAADFGPISLDLLVKIRQTSPTNPSSLPPPIKCDQGQRRPLIQKALLDIFLSITQQRRLVLAVDDIHRVDEPSMALLSALALENQTRPLIIALTVKTGSPCTAPIAFAVISRVARPIALTPLDVDATEALLRSVFGEVTNLRFLADRIFAISQGNPRSAMQLAQHLVDKGHIAYKSGAWFLPNRIDQTDLPSTLTEALRAKVAGLSPEAAELARTIVLNPDQCFSLDECLILAGHPNGARLTKELNELVASGLLNSEGPFYALSQRGWASVLTEGWEPELVRASHLRLARVFEQRGDQQFRMVNHLIKAGQPERALDVFLAHNQLIHESLPNNPEAFSQYVQSLPRDWALILDALLAICRDLGRPPKQRYLLMISLVVLNSISVAACESLYSVLAELRERLVRDTGLGIYRELEGSIDESERLSRAFEIAQRYYDQSPENDRVFSPLEAIIQLARFAIVCSAISVSTYDLSLIESLPSVTPLIALSPAFGVLEKDLENSSFLIGGDTERTRRGFLEFLERIDQPDHGGIEESVYEFTRLTVIMGVGMLEALVGMSSALDRAERIDKSPLLQVNAWRIRTIYYLGQGDFQKAEKCQKLVEMLQLQNSPSQFHEGADVIPELIICSHTDDLTGVRRTLEGIEKMAARFSGWVPILRYGQAEYHRIRGDHVTALAEAEHALALVTPGRHSFWLHAAYAQVRILTELGRLSEAKEAGYRHLEAAQRQGYVYTHHLLDLAVAVVEAKLGHHDNAIQLADHAIDLVKAIGATGSSLGLAYETRARVAFYANDPKGYKKYLKLCGECYRVGLNPVLTVKHQRLKQEAHRAFAGLAAEVVQASALSHSLSEHGDVFTSVRIYLADSQNHQNLLDKSLNMIVTRSGGKGGYLYLFEERELFLAAQSAIGPLPARVVQSMQEFFHGLLTEGTQLESTETMTGFPFGHDANSKTESFESTILSVRRFDQNIQVGIAIVTDTDKTVSRPTRDFYDAIAGCVYESRRLLLAAQEVSLLASTGPSDEGRYRLEAILGESPTEAIYKVFDRRADTRVALKRVSFRQYGQLTETLDPVKTKKYQEQLERQLRREYETLKSLAHPHVVAVFDFGVDRAGAYYTMELLERADLYSLMSSVTSDSSGKAAPRLSAIPSVPAGRAGSIYTVYHAPDRAGPTGVRDELRVVASTSAYGHEPKVLGEAASADHYPLGQLVPVDWKTVTVWLRELMSVLGLLHTRKLVHRDISPRSVFPTVDGHIKLKYLDTMAPMGLPTDRLGTLPLIAPEVIYRQPLDARSDLYACGALAYWLLTARHAYPVGSPAAFPEAWRTTPPIPSQLAREHALSTDIPEAFDRLIMDLLRVDPAARPKCAAEVMERLTAIAGVPADAPLAVPSAAVAAPPLVGRAEDLRKVRKRVVRSTRQRGCALVIEAEPGLGRSRLLDACVMEGKRAGMTVLRARGNEAFPGSYAIIRTLFDQLLEEIPEIAKEAAGPNISLLARVIPELVDPKKDDDHTVQSPIATAELLGLSSLQALVLQRIRPQLQVALRDWMVKISRSRALMIAVDDFSCSDEPSAAFLALLAQEVQTKQIMLVITVRSGGRMVSPNTLGLIQDAGSTLALTPLGPEQTTELVGSVFGNGPTIEALAARLHGISRGNPRAIMIWVQHIVDNGLAHYRSGAWTFPATIAASELPNSLPAVLQARRHAFHPEALRLAQAFALSPDQRFSLEECQILSEHADLVPVLRDLDALVVAAALDPVEQQAYALSHRDWISVLTDTLDDANRSRLHARLAEVFHKRGTDPFRVAHHLLRADDNDRALDMLIDIAETARQRLERSATSLRAYYVSLPSNWAEMFEEALERCAALSRPQKHRFVLQRTLLALSQTTGTVKKTHITGVMNRLVYDSGLDVYLALTEPADKRARLQQALETAQHRYEACPERDRVLSPEEAVRDLGRALVDVAFIAATSMDYSLIGSVPSIDPLTLLSSGLDVVGNIVQAARHINMDQYEKAVLAFRTAQERLEEPELKRGLERTHRRYTLFAVIAARGLTEAYLGVSRSLECADQIERDPLHQATAWRIRTINYLLQGDEAKAAQCRELLERVKIQNHLFQFFEGAQIFTEYVAYLQMEDLSGLNRTMGAIERMAENIENWSPILDHARGEVYRLSGDISSALRHCERVIAAISSGRHIIWACAADSHLRILLAFKRFSEAQSAGRRYLQIARDQNGEYYSNNITAPLAMAEAELGHFQEAVTIADRMIRYWIALGSTGVNLGLACETRARVAIRQRDGEGFRRYALRCAEQYLPGKAPALAAKYTALMEAGRQAGLEMDGSVQIGWAGSTALAANDPTAEVRKAIRECSDSEQRASRALAMLIEQCGAKSGYLFGFAEDRLKLLSRHDEPELSPELDEGAASYLAAEIDDWAGTATAFLSQAAADPVSTLSGDGGGHFEPVLLCSTVENRTVVVGLAALVPLDGNRTLRPAPPQVTSAICEALLEKGDVGFKYAAS